MNLRLLQMNEKIVENKLAIHSDHEAELMEIAERLNALSDKILFSNNDNGLKVALIKRYEELMPLKLKLELQIKSKG